MTQETISISNQAAVTARTALNNAMKTVTDNFSGASEPSTTYANAFWFDDTNNILKIRNEADDGWIPIGYLEQSNSQFHPILAGNNYFDLGRLFYADGNDFASPLAFGTAGQTLTVNSAGTAPEWTTITNEFNLTETTITNDATVEFELDHSNYDVFIFDFHDVKVSISSPVSYISAYLSDDSGASWKDNYYTATSENEDILQYGNKTSIPLHAKGITSGVTNGYSGRMKLASSNININSGWSLSYGYESASSTGYLGELVTGTSGGRAVGKSSPFDRIKFSPDLGLFTSGKIMMRAYSKA